MKVNPIRKIAAGTVRAINMVGLLLGKGIGTLFC